MLLRRCYDDAIVVLFSLMLAAQDTKHIYRMSFL